MTAGEGLEVAVGTRSAVGVIPGVGVGRGVAVGWLEGAVAIGEDEAGADVGDGAGSAVPETDTGLMEGVAPSGVADLGPATPHAVARNSASTNAGTAPVVRTNSVSHCSADTSLSHRSPLSAPIELLEGILVTAGRVTTAACPPSDPLRRRRPQPG